MRKVVVFAVVAATAVFGASRLMRRAGVFDHAGAPAGAFALEARVPGLDPSVARMELELSYVATRCVPFVTCWYSLLRGWKPSVREVHVKAPRAGDRFEFTVEKRIWRGGFYALHSGRLRAPRGDRLADEGYDRREDVVRLSWTGGSEHLSPGPDGVLTWVLHARENENLQIGVDPESLRTQALVIDRRPVLETQFRGFDLYQTSKDHGWRDYQHPPTGAVARYESSVRRLRVQIPPGEAAPLPFVIHGIGSAPVLGPPEVEALLLPADSELCARPSGEPWVVARRLPSGEPPTTAMRVEDWTALRAAHHYRIAGLSIESARLDAIVVSADAEIRGGAACLAVAALVPGERQLIADAVLVEQLRP